MLKQNYGCRESCIEEGTASIMLKKFKELSEGDGLIILMISKPQLFSR